MSIKVENLSKYYGQQQAVKNISFEIKSGEVVGFLGPNGAGKSTTMKMITTYLTPNEGAINVDGIDMNEDALSVRKKIGYLPEQNPLYNDMNVIDYLNYAAELQSVQKDEIPEAVKKMVKLCGLEEVKHKDIGELSKGYKQRVGLAQAMIHNPDVLLLDEPTNYLDENHIEWLAKFLQNYEHSFILISHDVSFLNKVVNVIYHLENCELTRYSGDYDKFQEMYAIYQSQKAAASLLGTLQTVSSCTRSIKRALKPSSLALFIDRIIVRFAKAAHIPWIEKFTAWFKERR